MAGEEYSMPCFKIVKPEELHDSLPPITKFLYNA